MDQHPIPRNVTGFEFQLIGFMTLKQFFYLLFAAGFALVFWKAPLGILSIPLAIVSGLVGVAFAFVPIQERPMEIWIKNFLFSIYSPTQFIWKQEQKLPEYLRLGKGKKHKKSKKKENVEMLHEDTRDKLDAYLKTVDEKEGARVDKQEEELLARVSVYINNPNAGIIQKSSVDSIGVKKVPDAGIITGTVRSGDKPLSDILITAYDKNTEPARMVKSDNKGHFKTKLPLPEGVYKLTTEDPGKKYEFKKYSFTVGAAPLKPWLIVPTNNIN